MKRDYCGVFLYYTPGSPHSVVPREARRQLQSYDVDRRLNVNEPEPDEIEYALFYMRVNW